MAEYERQHYIPQFWLKYFADEHGYVNFVDKNGKEDYRNPDSIFLYKNLYDLPEGDAKELEKTCNA